MTRWVRALEVAGALVEVENGRVPRPRGTGHGAVAVARAAAGGSSVRAARRRASRLATSRAREDGVPAYVVLHDATLDELAARRPRSTGELAAIRGFGPTKLERYGDELLALLAAG